MVYRWLEDGTQVVSRWYTGGQQMVHRWLEDGIQVVGGLCTDG